MEAADNRHLYATKPRRKASKTQATGAHPQRNEQFEKIEQLVGDYQQVGNPVMSMDTKKRS